MQIYMRLLQFILLFLMLSLFVVGCSVSNQTRLSDLQITACNSAEKGNTCDTKLEDIGLISKDSCCKNLGACC